ncbi:major facilitator superfamily domain-containing protein 6-like [Orbicella faveolata]|uniref:major facilitator superfamily domain-containing protein 6-like n=1 Tax=Orbicella faveolata TaxID=48498 RepID=UPI0009E1C3AF|nr:major facilitator superfamily domain-containing protein 6-like [Orbicella faveolata]
MENEEEMRKAVSLQELEKARDRKRKRDKIQQSSYFKCFYEADYLVFKGFCFFLYGAYGGFIPYLPLYFKQLFLGASYAGIIVGIRPLIQCIGAPFWGVIADRYHAGRIIFLGSVIAWIVKAFVILAVRPHDQHCIEMYSNKTANVSYVYAYDLWTETKQEEKWVVLPLDNPIIIEKNKIAVVEEHEIKHAPDESLPKEVLENSGPLDQKGKTKKGRRTYKHQAYPEKEVLDEKMPSKMSRRSEQLARRVMNKTKADDDVLYESEVKIDLNESKQNEALSSKITHVVEVYKEELNASVTFITNIDTKEVDFMFVLFMIIIIVGEFLESPTYALSDASLLKRLGDDREYYGRIRMWGSLGWAVASAMVGLLINYSTFKLCQVVQNNYIIAFYVFVGFVAAAFANSLWFRFSYDDEKKFEDIGKVAPMLLSLRHTSFLLATLYTGFCYGILVHFVNWYIDDIGGSSAIMGAAGAAREISALIMFAMSATTLQALGNVNSMVLCLLVYIICFICYSILDDPWVAVALEVLDGGTYGLVWSTCVNYMSAVGSSLGVIETTQGKTQPAAG